MSERGRQRRLGVYSECAEFFVDRLGLNGIRRESTTKQSAKDTLEKIISFKIVQESLVKDNFTLHF